MSLINWIFDAYQHHKLDQTRQETSQLRSELEHMRQAGGGMNEAHLQQAVGELALAIKTIQRLAVEKGLCTRDEFQRMMREVDAEDGRIDGQAPV
jgi:hypothetical protein